MIRKRDRTMEIPVRMIPQLIRDLWGEGVVRENLRLRVSSKYTSGGVSIVLSRRQYRDLLAATKIQSIKERYTT